MRIYKPQQMLSMGFFKLKNLISMTKLKIIYVFLSKMLLIKTLIFKKMMNTVT